MELCFYHIAITHLILQITVQYAEQAYQFCLPGGHAISFDAMWIQCHCRIIPVKPRIPCAECHHAPVTGSIPPAERNLRFMGMILNENVNTDSSAFNPYMPIVLTVIIMHVFTIGIKRISEFDDESITGVKRILSFLIADMSVPIIRVRDRWFNSLFEIIHVPMSLKSIPVSRETNVHIVQYTNHMVIA